MRYLALASVAALALVVGVIAPVASAHNPTITISCQTIEFDYAGFPPGSTSTATEMYSIDGGAPVTMTFHFSGATASDIVTIGLSGSHTVSASSSTVDSLNDGTWTASEGPDQLSCSATGMCHETVNPAGNPAVGNNGFPNDPFGGDAVPGGKDTSPGTKGNGPINSDGFYLVGGLLFSDDTAIPYPGGGFVWPDNTTIKYTQWGNKNIKITSAIGGPKSAIEYHVQAPGDLYIGAGKSGGGVFCGVPPPPF
jgi:hypothetical protein